MRMTALIGAVLWGSSLTGCLTMEAHRQELAEIARSCETATRTALSFDQYEKEATAEIHALKEEQSRLTKEFLTAQRAFGQAKTDLESTQYHLAREREARTRAEERAAKLEQVQELLQMKVDELGARLEAEELRVYQGIEVRAQGQARLDTIAQERSRLATLLLSAQTDAATARAELATSRRDLVREERERREAQREMADMEQGLRQMERLEVEVRRERDRLREERDALRGQADELTVQLHAAQASLVDGKRSLSKARARIVELEERKTRTEAALTEARLETVRLKEALAAERDIWTGLQDTLKKVETSPPQKATPAEKNAPEKQREATPGG